MYTKLSSKTSKRLKLIKISETEKQGKQVENVLNKSGLVKITEFLQLLETIGSIPTKTKISERRPKIIENYTDSDRLNAVYEYISNNFQKEIRLENVAKIANMTPPSFCRYFKQRTGKTLSQFITEMKIDFACTQLLETDLTINEVCYKSGYSNFSNFIKQFKKIKQLTPKSYKNKHLELLK